MILWQSQFHMNHLKVGQRVAFKEKNRPFFNQLYDAGLGM